MVTHLFSIWLNKGHGVRNYSRKSCEVELSSSLMEWNGNSSSKNKTSLKKKNSF